MIRTTDGRPAAAASIASAALTAGPRHPSGVWGPRLPVKPPPIQAKKRDAAEVRLGVWPSDVGRCWSCRCWSVRVGVMIPKESYI